MSAPRAIADHLQSGDRRRLVTQSGLRVWGGALELKGASNYVADHIATLLEMNDNHGANVWRRTPMPPDRAPAAPHGVITRHGTLRRASVSHRPLARPASASGPACSR